MPADVLGGPWAVLANYGVQLFAGLRRALGPGNPRIYTPITDRGRVITVLPDPPAKPLPAAPTPTPVSPYETRQIDEPKRQSGRKPKYKNRGKADKAIRDFLHLEGVEYFTTWLDSLPQPVKDGIEYAAYNPSGAPGTTVPRTTPRPTPGAGTRSAQRGFVAPELVPLIANPPTPARAPLPSRAPRLVPGSLPGIESPTPAPQVEPQPTAPEVLRPEFYEPDLSEALRRIPAAPEPIYPGPGPATATPSPTRSPGPTGPSTAKPGKTGSRAPVALPTLGKIVLSPDSLLTYAVGLLPRRSTAAGTISPGVSPATPRTGSTAREPLATLTQPLGERIRNKDDCECEKPKKRSPRPPRTQCFTGTYTETARGLVKRRREQVPC